MAIVRKTWRGLRWVWTRFYEFLAGEWMFWWGRPNGAAIIFLRSIQISLSLWLVALALRSILNAKCPCHLSLDALWVKADDTITWLGTIFFAVYAALYSRFSNQMNYLSGTYNLLMQTQAMIDNPNDNSKIQHWKAALVEDADDLHLATKPMFSGLVYFYLTDPKVGPMFEADALNGTKRRAKLQKRLLKTLGPDLPIALTKRTPQPAVPGSQGPVRAAAATGLVAAIIAWRWWQ